MSRAHAFASVCGRLAGRLPTRATVLRRGSRSVLRVRAWAMSSPRRRELTLELGDRLPLLKRIATRARYTVTRQDLGEQLWGRGGDIEQLPSDALPWHGLLQAQLARRDSAAVGPAAAPPAAKTG